MTRFPLLTLVMFPKDSEDHDQRGSPASNAARYFDSQPRPGKRNILTKFIKSKLLAYGMIGEKSKVPWKSMHLLCWEHGYFWDGVPLEIDWDKVRLMESDSASPWVRHWLSHKSTVRRL